ncbi:unnamed protein product [Prorocentrum cordatum]|uniref:Uncharacterized protein n=1 Tax=Prorocentrum cordatum TaxID=2364126 RepID=A0ABN9VTG7_9DINO|nr:unnamed protein product [Polarella glacialis]
MAGFTRGTSGGHLLDTRVEDHRAWPHEVGALESQAATCAPGSPPGPATSCASGSPAECSPNCSAAAFCTPELSLRGSGELAQTLEGGTARAGKRARNARGRGGAEEQPPPQRAPSLLARADMDWGSTGRGEEQDVEEEEEEVEVEEEEHMP